MITLRNINLKIEANIRGLILSVFMLSCISLFAAINFEEASQFSSGRWVKVEVPSTGLYQISYSLLREMGFENPERVGVYGRGGRQMDPQFVDASEKQIYSDRLPEVSVIHRGESLYFYGKGCDVVEFRPGESGVPNRFASVSKNIYSNSAYYFLSDSGSVKEATVSETSNQNREIESGLDYLVHEQDMFQNRTMTGQLFWGESFMNGMPKYEWKFSTPYAMPGFARLDCAFYMERSYSDWQVNGDFKIGIAEAGSPYSIRKSSIISSKFSPITLNHSYTHDGSPTSTIEIEASSEESGFLNLDYWVYNYTKRIPEGKLVGESSERYGVKTEASVGYEVKLAEGLELLDISDAQNIRVGVRAEDGSGMVRFIPQGTATELLVWDPLRMQNQIAGWREVTDANLHALSDVELLIVSNPQFRSHAERLAELHRDHDGINVAVVTPEEVYNEFSCGTPDAIAIRALVKKLYDQGGGRLKNLLLYGATTGDVRHPSQGRSIWDEIISYQHSDLSESSHAAPIYDYYCMTDDRLSSLSQINIQNINVGVGILSCESEKECELIYNKIKNYLEDESHVWALDETVTIGGLQDAHAHDQQAEDYSNYLRRIAPTGICASTISKNAYGEAAAKGQWLAELNRGKIFNVYFGHGSFSMIGKTRTFFTSMNVPELTNRYTGIMFMGGCDFSLPDQKRRGLGEKLVLDTEHGMIATIISTRTAWSNQNFELGKRVARNWLSPSEDFTGRTLGEIFASSKTQSDYTNTLVFTLVGDPALKIPAPLRNVNVELSAEQASAGEKLTVKGKVLKEDETDGSFSGKAVVKIMEPRRVIRSADYVEKYKDASGNQITLDVTYDNTLIAAAETTLLNGEFSFDIVVPASAARFEGEALPVRVSVFDKSTWTGGIGEAELQIAAVPEDKQADKFDMSAPEISANYSPMTRRVEIVAADNEAIAAGTGALRAKLNGEERSLIASEYENAGETTRLAEAFIDMENEADGKYLVEIEAIDVAGNRGVRTVEVEKISAGVPLQVNLAAKTTLGMVEAEIVAADGSEISESLLFELEDSRGEVVAAGNCGSRLNFDCRNVSGKALLPGLYRLRVKGAGSNSRLYSGNVSFALFS